MLAKERTNHPMKNDPFRDSLMRFLFVGVAMRRQLVSTRSKEERNMHVGRIHSFVLDARQIHEKDEEIRLFFRILPFFFERFP